MASSNSSSLSQIVRNYSKERKVNSTPFIINEPLKDKKVHVEGNLDDLIYPLDELQEKVKEQSEGSQSEIVLHPLDKYQEKLKKKSSKLEYFNPQTHANTYWNTALINLKLSSPSQPSPQQARRGVFDLARRLGAPTTGPISSK